MLKAKVKEYLVQLKSIASDDYEKIKFIDCDSKLDEAMNRYDDWFNATSEILNKGFTSKHQQFFNMLNSDRSLGNLYDGFEKKRSFLTLKYPKNINVIDIALNSLIHFDNIDLLPIDSLTNSDLLTLKKATNMKKVFISHSSKDAKIARLLIDLIEGIGLSEKQIFCSSYQGYGVPLGDDFLNYIKDELNSDVFVIFVLTKNFYNSPICLCEMGATWVKSNKRTPILVPPMKFSDMKGVFPPTTKSIEINDKSALNLLRDTFLDFFNLKAKDSNHWESKRDKFLEEFNRLSEDDISSKLL